MVVDSSKNTDRLILAITLLTLGETDRLVLLRDVVEDTRVPDPEFRNDLEWFPAG